MSAEAHATRAAPRRAPSPVSTASTNSTSEPPSPTSAATPTTPRRRERSGTLSNGTKPCFICAEPRNVLIRCQIDESGKWNFVCPDTCLQTVTGAGADADPAQLQATQSFYRYGGTWKNRHELVSAKVKGVAAETSGGLMHSPGRPKHSRKASQKDGRDLRAFMARRMSVDEWTAAE